MQSNTPLPINAFLSKFPVEVRSAEDGQPASGQAPVQTGAVIVENSGFDFQASTNVNKDQTGHTTSAQIALETSDFQTYGRLGETPIRYAPANAVIQDTIYTFQNEGPATYTNIQSGNMATNSISVARSNPGLIHSFFPMPSGVYNQQDPAAPNGHNYVRSNASLSTDQNRGGSLAFVVIPGVPAFSIPIEVANVLLNMYQE